MKEKLGSICVCLSLIGALTSKPYAFVARSWELERLDSLDFFDGMLSNIVLDIRGLHVIRVLPRINESLNEEWITDKVRFAYDGFRRQRILTPYYRFKNTSSLFPLSWEDAFFFFFLNYNLVFYDYQTYNKLQIVIGRFLDFESIVSCRDFFSELPHSRSSIDFFNKRREDVSFIGNFSLSLSSMEEADLFLILGSNLRYENPLLHLKLLRSVTRGGSVFSFMSPSNFRFKTYSLGSDVVSYLKFLNGNSKFSLVISKSRKRLVIASESLKIREDSKSFLTSFNLLKSLGFSFHNLSASASSMNFNAIGSFDFYNNIYSKFLFLYGADEIHLKPGTSFVVYQGHHGDHGASVSDLVLPATFVLEKKGSFLDLSGTSFSKSRFALTPSSMIRTDWRIFSALSFFFDFKSRVVLHYGELLLRCKIYVPFFNSTRRINLLASVKSCTSNYLCSFYNVLGFSFYVDYYSSDVVSRSSKIMALAGVRLKKKFINF